METLRPCPFCGDNAYFNISSHIRRSGNLEYDFTIRCSNCGISLNENYAISIELLRDGELKITQDERQEAIDRWNGVKNEGDN
jgi:hypothetical protein